MFSHQVILMLQIICLKKYLSANTILNHSTSKKKASHRY